MKGSVRNRRRLVTGVAVVAALAACTSALVATSSAGAAGSVRGFDGTRSRSPAWASPRSWQRPDRRAGADQTLQRHQRDQGRQDQLRRVRRRQAGPGHRAVGGAAPRHPGRGLRDSSATCRSSTRPTTSLSSRCPYFGWAFDNSYCSHDPSTKLWGFGYNGCLVPSDPSFSPTRPQPVHVRRARRPGRSTRPSRCSRTTRSRARTR